MFGRLFAALLLTAICLTPRPAHAWGAQGHRVVGLVAEQLLDEHTRAAIRELAGQESLADIATWMDEERPRLGHLLPGSAKWHYDDIPLCGAGTVDCRDGNCASRALERYRRILANRSADPAQRLLALRILVHVVGDIHQPMHAVDDDDRGGNEVAVSLSSSRANGRAPAHNRGRGHGHGRSLHSVWDVDLVRQAVSGESDTQFASALLAEQAGQTARIESGSFQDWINESHALARDVAYGHLPGFACGRPLRDTVVLSPIYQEKGVSVVRKRLAQAGIRLAAVLRTSLARP